MQGYSYTEFFAHYPEIFRQFGEIVNHRQNYFDELERRSLLNEVHSVLSIGPGEGFLELDLMQKKNFDLGIIEPVRSYVVQFKLTANRWKLESKIREIHEGPFQTFKSEFLYDLVISIHSWYAFGKNHQMIKKALQYLKPQGKLFISIVETHNPIQQLALATGRLQNELIDAQNFSQWLNQIGMDHQYWTNFNKIKGSVLMNQSSPTAQGKVFFSFPTLMAWDEMTLDLQQNLKEILEKAFDGRDYVLPNGCILLMNSP